MISHLELIEELYPICRSITGTGVRKTFEIISKYIPLETYEVETGTKVFDWEVPEEWAIHDAYIVCPDGSKIAQFKENNLHVMSYSKRINTSLTLGLLKEHIHTLPDHPSWIPYRTMYYDRSWAFCLSQNTLDSLPEGKYRAYIDASHKNGSLTYAEAVFPGTSGKEIIFSTYVCHPSMCNDNLSSVSVMIKLAQELANKNHRHTYRLLFLPETIGAITWLSKNEKSLSKIIAGVNLTCTGNRAPITFMKSRQKTSISDKAMKIVLDDMGLLYKENDFSPIGSDERQYCSPGINLPVVTLMRTPPGEFEEYHTSADNFDVISEDSLREMTSVCLSFVDTLEKNNTYINTYSKCEPQLGKRGLYRKTGGQRVNQVSQTAIKWVLSYSDGHNDLLDIANRSGIRMEEVVSASSVLEHQGIIMRISK